MGDVILVDRDGAIVTVTLNRPEKLNALNHATWTRLRDVFTELDRDDGIRCIVVRGAGDRAFAAGADISEFALERKDVKGAKAYGKAELGGVMAVYHCRHPTVALIRGACVGGGLEIACACDIRVAGRSSRFGIPINRLGLTMAYRELEFFLDVVGPAVAREILLEGAVFNADRAYHTHLIHRIVEDAEVEAEAYAAARRIAQGAPLVNRWHKTFIRRLGRHTRLTRAELDEGYAAFGTRDYQIGVRAFLDKRTPEFKGI